LEGKRERALVILKRRKHTQKQLEQIEATQQNIAEMVRVLAPWLVLPCC